MGEKRGNEAATPQKAEYVELISNSADAWVPSDVPSDVPQANVGSPPVTAMYEVQPEEARKLVTWAVARATGATEVSPDPPFGSPAGVSSLPQDRAAKLGPGSVGGRPGPGASDNTSTRTSMAVSPVRASAAPFDASFDDLTGASDDEDEFFTSGMTSGVVNVAV